MKRIILICTAGFFLAACANEANTDSTKDTTNTTIAPDNTIHNDTSSRLKDTSSYERMPQKSADSIPQ